MSMTVHFTGTLHERIKQVKEERSVGLEAFVGSAVAIVLNDSNLLNQAVETAMRDGNQGVGRVEAEGE